MSPIIVLLLGIYVCQGHANPEDIVANGTNIFSYKVFKVLNEKGGNVLFSPISAHIPLSLVLQGADGVTASELETGLALTPDRVSIRSGYRSFLNQINGDKLKLATRLYPRVGLTIKSEFLSIARNDFHSNVKELDYSDPAKAVETINQFVEEKTNNTIHNLIKPNDIDASTDIVIVNAAYFKDNWDIPFTYEYYDDFFNNGKDKVNVTMMAVTNMFSYKSFPTYQAVRLRFNDLKYSMVIVLPHELDGLQRLEGILPPIPDLLKELDIQAVHVVLPKFEIEKEINFKPVLLKMGVTTMFSDSADLTGIIEGLHSKVSEVIQKARMKVTQYGVEASAATAVINKLTSNGGIIDSPKQFLANHPFMFFLLSDDTIMFQGSCAQL